ncbi:MAG: hypothetical protein QOH52_1329 [Pseudonocardiales bacterium]|jgi:hypothetical protein|nr:hypothetical protein [Pseudonocardiales bacterium]
MTSACSSSPNTIAAGMANGPFVADAEAIYSYEGTREMNVRAVTRHLTTRQRARVVSSGAGSRAARVPRRPILH